MLRNGDCFVNKRQSKRECLRIDGRGATTSAASTRGNGRTQCGALRIKDGDGEMELRAFTHFTVDPDAAAVNFNEVLGDGKAKAGAAGFARAGCIHAVETFEDAWLVGLRNANTGIGDGEYDFLIFCFRAQHDFSTRERVLDGIVQQVLEDFLETAAVSGNIG